MKSSWRLLIALCVVAVLSVLYTNFSSPEQLPDDPKVAPFTARTTPHVATEFRWSGGGVSGASEGEENFNLDTNVHVTLLREFETAVGIPAATFESLDNSNSKNHDLTAFIKFFAANVALNTNEDCAIRLDPNHQLLCHVWAAQQHNKRTHGHTNNTNKVIRNSSLFKGNALNSMCSLFLACIVWKRGRYSIPLSNEFLQSTFDKVANDRSLLSGSSVLLRNLIHGGSNWREYDWLADRVQISRELVGDQTGPIDVRAVFQGGGIAKKEMDANGAISQLNFLSRDNGENHHRLTRPLSALEAIAVLHHRATAGKMQMVVFPRAVVTPGGDAAEECRVPAINVLVFSGDSLAHQMFSRLLDLMRHGPEQVLVPYGTELLKSNFRHWPAHHRYKSSDMIFAVYPTHDEFLSFQSLMPYAALDGEQFVRSNKSVIAYFAAVAKRRATNFCVKKKRVTDDDDNCSAAASRLENDNNTEAVFYLVFLWDVITTRPRTDALAPCVPALPIFGFPPKKCRNLKRLKVGASRGLTLMHAPSVPSLRALGVRIPMHVINANIWELHESSTTYEWLMRMATGNCRVLSPTKNATAMSSGGVDWRFGEHPTSDTTHLYRASTTLMLSPFKTPRQRYCHNSLKTPSRRKPFSPRLPTDHRVLARLETPFRWLHDAVTNVIGSDPMKKLKHNSSLEMEGKHHRLGTFYSRLRVLDFAKVFLAPENVFRQADGLHERCNGSHWLVGAAIYRDTTQALRTSAESLTREVSSILQPTAGYYGEDCVPLRFDKTDDCYGLGTMLSLNALLLDIVQSEKG